MFWTEEVENELGRWEEEKRSLLLLTLLLAKLSGEEGASDGWHLCLPECAIRPLGKGKHIVFANKFLVWC